MNRGENWSEQQVRAIQRDKMCKFPGCGRTDFLQVHHITPYRKTRDNSLNNLITLCPKHHKHEDNHFTQHKQISMTLRRLQGELWQQGDIYESN